MSPEDARSAMENRVMDCEICQDACPWNAKHIATPLPTDRMTSFHTTIPGWEDFFSLPNLVKLTERDYHEVLDPLNTTIPYTIFHRNVMLAVEKMTIKPTSRCAVGTVRLNMEGVQKTATSSLKT